MSDRFASYASAIIACYTMVREEYGPDSWLVDIWARAENGEAVRDPERLTYIQTYFNVNKGDVKSVTFRSDGLRPWAHKEEGPEKFAGFLETWPVDKSITEYNEYRHKAGYVGDITLVKLRRFANPDPGAPLFYFNAHGPGASVNTKTTEVLPYTDSGDVDGTTPDK